MYRIDSISLQEMRAPQAEYYNEDGFKLILSCGDKEKTSWTGVGFIIALWHPRSFCVFRQISDRLTSWKVKVQIERSPLSQATRRTI